MSQTDITIRFLACIDKLVADGRVNSRRQFAMNLKYHAQGITEMSAGRREIPLDLLAKSVAAYQLNPVFLLTGKGSMFSSASDDDVSIRQLSIVTDQTGKERIVHVPVTAQAGYGSLSSDPVFVQELPTYQLPDNQFTQGSYRSFEISGSSMEPTFFQNDIVIASYLEPRYWAQALHDGWIVVIVTQHDVFIKRILNRLKSHQQLECISDNVEFEPFTLAADEIKELWRARVKMTSHMEQPHAHAHVALFSQQLQTQQRLLEELTEKMQASSL